MKVSFVFFRLTLFFGTTSLPWGVEAGCFEECASTNWLDGRPACFAFARDGAGSVSLLCIGLMSIGEGGSDTESWDLGCDTARERGAFITRQPWSVPTKAQIMNSSKAGRPRYTWSRDSTVIGDKQSGDTNSLQGMDGQSTTRYARSDAWDNNICMTLSHAHVEICEGEQVEKRSCFWGPLDVLLRAHANKLG